MTALTLWPEWAWAIDALPGPLAKRVENRGFPIWPRLIGQWVALHAGKHIGGKPGRGYTYGGLINLRDMAQLAGWESGVGGDPPTWAIACRIPGFTSADRIAYAWSCSADYAGKRPGPEPKPIVTSAILGHFRVTRILQPHEISMEDGIRGWKVVGEYGWVFEYRRLASPVPTPYRKGETSHQGLWEVPDYLAVQACP